TDEFAVIVAFVTSPEFTAKNPSDDAFVRALYKVLLNRQAAPEEVAYWQQILQSGARSRAQVAYLFLSSDEAYRDAVDLDYQRYLGRSESPAEQQGWVTALERDLATPTTVTLTFLASDEYLARALTRS